MSKTILITGSTDGIGLLTGDALVKQGHKVIVHGRNQTKLTHAVAQLSGSNPSHDIDQVLADLSDLAQAREMVKSIEEKYEQLDVLINNAGIYRTNITQAAGGLDLRFVVNTLAPYYLAKSLKPLMNSDARVVNLSSAAQAPLMAEELTKHSPLGDGSVYAKSKLALTMWSRYCALHKDANSPLMVAVNPASMLGSKMVKEAYGVSGGDMSIGADILVRAAISGEFADANGKYFDNDIGQFSSPHPDALDDNKCQQVVDAIEAVLSTFFAEPAN